RSGYWGRRHVASSLGLDFEGFDLAGPARHLARPGGRRRLGAGPPAECARRVRFLRAVAVVVAFLLRGGLRARQRGAFAGPVRRAAVFLRGARAVSTIRAWLSRLLPNALAAARSQH